jgi:hypothetical protein
VRTYTPLHGILQKSGLWSVYGNTASSATPGERIWLPFTLR